MTNATRLVVYFQAFPVGNIIDQKNAQAMDGTVQGERIQTARVTHHLQ
jgi:hypothetical protein